MVAANKPRASAGRYNLDPILQTSHSSPLPLDINDTTPSEGQIQPQASRENASVDEMSQHIDIKAAPQLSTGKTVKKSQPLPAPWIVRTAYVDDTDYSGSSFQEVIDRPASAASKLNNAPSRLSFAPNTMLRDGETSPLGPRAFSIDQSSLAPKRHSTSSLVSLRIDLRLKECLEGQTNSPVSLHEFREYMITVEKGCEQIDFYLAVEDLRRIWTLYISAKIARLPTQGELMDSIQSVSSDITENFILTSGEQQINISSDTRSALLEQYNRIGYFERDTLIPAQKYVYYLTENDAWQRFLKKSLVSNVGDERRRLFLIQGMVGSTFYVIAALVLFLAFREDLSLRWLIIAPACLASSGTIQSYWDFCLVYGLTGRIWQQARRGQRGQIIAIQDTCARSSHRKRAIVLIMTIAVAAIAITLPIVMVP